MHPASIQSTNLCEVTKMAELQQMMFYEDLIIALIYFIGFGGLLLIGGSFEAAGNLILKWVRGRRGR